MGLKLYFDEHIAESNIEKISFDSDLWEIYRGAGGNIKDQLMSLINGTEDFEELSHQMSFYKATYLAFPYLVTLLEKKEKENDFQGQMNLISRMGICLGTDVKWMNDEKADEAVMSLYNNSKEILKEKTKRFINTYENEIIESDEDIKSMFITALPAIFDNPEFTFLIFGTYTCPECGKSEKVISFMKDYYILG